MPSGVGNENDCCLLIFCHDHDKVLPCKRLKLYHLQLFFFLIVSSLECAGRVFSGWEMVRFLSEHFQKY